MAFRWIMTVFLSLLFSATVAGSYFMGLHVAALENTLQSHKKALRTLQRTQSELISQQKEAQEWRELMKTAEQFRVVSDRWTENPLQVAREYEWEGVSRTLSFLSSGNPVRTGFWFQPSHFAVYRREQKKAEDPLMLTEKSTGAAQALEQTQAQNEQQGSYRLVVRGRFVTPKPAPAGK